MNGNPSTGHDPDHARRLNALEDDFKYLREDLSDALRSMGQQETTVAIFGSQLQQVVNRRPQWQTWIMAAGVFVTIWGLSLTPLSWLAIANHDRLETQRREIAELSAQLAAVATKAEANEQRGLEIHREQTARANRIEDRLNLTIDKQERKIE